MFKKTIILILIVSTLAVGSRNGCNLFLNEYSKAREKAMLHLDSDSGKFAILLELNMAKNSLISAIAECKPYRSELKGYNRMRPDLKKLSKLINNIKKW